MKPSTSMFLLTLFISVLLISGCGEDSPTQSVNDSPQFIISGELPGSYSGNGYISLFKTGGVYAVNSLASARIDTSGLFSLAVPPPSDELKSIKSIIPYPIQDRIEVSDNSAKYMEGYLSLVYNGKEGGKAQRVSGDSSAKYSEHYFYIDRDVTIKGSASLFYSSYEYNITAKKGWNAIQIRSADNNYSYVNNIELQNSYFECSMYIILPYSLRWRDGDVFPN